MERVFDPYHKWLGIPPEYRPPTHYRLLGLTDLEADPDVIQSAADQRMAHLRTYQTGQYAEWSQRLLNEVAAARICLLNPPRKAAYDEQLQQAREAAMPPPDTTPATQPFAIVVDLPSPKPSSTLRPKRMPLGTIITGLITLVAALILGLVYWNAEQSTGTGVAARVTKRHTSDVRDATERPAAAAVAKKSQGGDVAKSKTPNTEPAGQAEEPIVQPPEAAVASSAAVEAQPHELERPSDAKLVVKPVPEAAEGESSREGDVDASEVFDGDGSVRREGLDAARGHESSEPTDSDAMPDERVSVPTAAAQQEAMKLARDLYKEEFGKAKTADEKTALAKKLLAQADAATSADAGTFVLLRLAKDIALQASNGETSFAAVDLMAERYRINAVGMKAEMLSTYAKKAKSPPQHLSIAEQAARLLEDAMAADDYAQAVTLAKLTTTEATVGHNKDLAQWAKASLPELQKKAKLAAEFDTAQETLAEQPDDATANLTAGTYYAYVRENWDKAIPFLAKGDDADLRSLAAQELEASPSTADAQIALGDAWWDAGQNADGTKRLAMLRRAGSWYAKSQADSLSGLSKVKVEKRLDELAKAEREAASAGPTRKLAAPIGKWFSLLPSPKELIGWETGECRFSYANRILDLRQHDMYCPIVAKDVSLRAKVRRRNLSTVRFIVRSSDQGCYIAQLTSGRWAIIKVSRPPAKDRGPGWNSLWGEEDTLSTVAVTRNFADAVFEMGFGVQGNTLTAYLNRQPVLQVQDATFTEGAVGIGTLDATGLYITDVELLIPNKGSLVGDRRTTAGSAKASNGR